MTHYRDLDLEPCSAGGEEQLFAFDRERRMHALAYEHWCSLLAGRAMPTLDDLDAGRLGGFTGNCVLIELGVAGSTPTISFVGQKLRAQADIGPTRDALDDVADDAVLVTLLRHLPEVIGLAAPARFEAERTDGDTGRLHRGILLPFADGAGALRAILGVISWSEMAAVEETLDIAAAIGSALAIEPLPAATSPWTDASNLAAICDAPDAPRTIDQQLAAARTWAALAASDRTAAASLNAALSATYDLLLMARARGVERMSRGEVLAALVFVGAPRRGDRLRYAATLDHAARLGLGPGRLASLLDRTPGGHVALAAAERTMRRTALQHVVGWEMARQVPASSTLVGPVDNEFLQIIGHRSAAPAAIASIGGGDAFGAEESGAEELRHAG